MEDIYSIKLNFPELEKLEKQMGHDWLVNELFNDFSESRVREIVKGLRRFRGVQSQLLE